jgi:fructose-1,6-bisphosphatase II
MVLERERHQALIRELRSIGVRIKFLSDGDVAGAIAPAFPESGIDLYMGSGGAPEGVLAAAALRCLGGEFQGRLMPSSDEEYNRCVSMGLKDPRQVLTMQALTGDDDVIFAATGVTPGEFLGGVTYMGNQRAVTHSLVMRAKTGTIRFVKSIHYLPKKPFLSRALEATGSF